MGSPARQPTASRAPAMEVVTAEEAAGAAARRLLASFMDFDADVQASGEALTVLDHVKAAAADATRLKITVELKRQS